MKRAIVFALVSLVWSAGAISGWAQETRATLRGQVMDSQGAVILGATVTVTSDDTGVKQVIKTNEQGAWTMPFLNPGHYTVSVGFSGFKTAERKGITLATADDKQVDITLEVGVQTQQVIVSGEAPLIDTTSATSGTVITPDEINEIPQIARIPTLLSGLSPGVLLLDQNQNLPRMWSVNAASDIRVNGGRDQRSNEFLIDGSPDDKKDRIAFIPPEDAVAEFRIMTNNYDAQYGHQAGGTINMSLKSGTSKYHGDLYEFNQNAALNAVLFQTNLAQGTRPPVHYNLYGGTFGGPVQIPKVYNGKDKTFFFFTYEGTRNQDPRFTIQSVPTALERQGNFSQSFTFDSKGTKFPIRIYNPYSLDPNRPTQKARTQFLNNTIPPGMFSPVAKAILQYVPFPNKPSELTRGNAVDNFVPSSTRQNQMASVVTRIDHSWNNNHKSYVSVRWNHETEILDDYFANVSTGGGPNKRINHGIGLDHVWTVSPSKVLDARLSITRWQEPTVSHGVGFDPTSLGLPSSFAGDQSTPAFPRIVGLFGDIGVGNIGSNDNSTVYAWNGSLTHVHGNMTFHYGGEFRLIQEAEGPGGSQGQFNFDNVNWTKQVYDDSSPGTGNGSRLAAFLLGLPNGGGFNRNVARFDTQYYYGLFFQNDWRATPRLTLNMGLRWDVERPWFERYDRGVNNFDPTAVNPITPSAQAKYAQIVDNPAAGPILAQLKALVPPDQFIIYGDQLFHGVNGQPRQATNIDWREFQPRVGFAYRLRPQTVIRGGFGRFVQSSSSKGNTFGFDRTTSFTATINNFFSPFDTLDQPFSGGVFAPTGSSLGPLTNLGQGPNWDNQNPDRPYSWEYSLHLQQEYKGWLFEVGYSHNKTYNIYQDRNQNLPSFNLWDQLRKPRLDQNYVNSHPTCEQDNSCRPADKLLADENIPNPFQFLPGVTGGVFTSQNRSFYDLIRPIKILGDLNRHQNPLGKNQYDAMQVRVERRFKKGFSVINAFTWSKLFEDTSFVGPEIVGHVEHKLGGEDRPFKFSVAPIWEVPLGTGKRFGGGMPRVANGILGGWELSGQFTIQSGTPVVFGTNAYYDGQPFGLPRGVRSLDEWFDTSHWVRFPNDKNITYDDLHDPTKYPAWTGVQNLQGYNFRPPGNDPNRDSNKDANGVFNDFGNYVRTIPTRFGTVRADRVNEVNLGLFKNFKPTERTKLQFRLETFNTFNHPRFGAPHTDPTQGSFGQVDKVQLNTPRLVQLAVKLYF